MYKMSRQNWKSFIISKTGMNEKTILIDSNTEKKQILELSEKVTVI